MAQINLTIDAIDALRIMTQAQLDFQKDDWIGTHIALNGHKIDGFFGEKYESALSWGRILFGFSWMIGLELRESDQIEERYVAISNHQIITKSRAIFCSISLDSSNSFIRPWTVLSCYQVLTPSSLELLQWHSEFLPQGLPPKNGWNIDSSQNFKLRQKVQFFKSWKMHFFKQYRRFEQIHQCLETTTFK